jgi:hypothetical protein
VGRSCGSSLLSTQHCRGTCSPFRCWSSAELVLNVQPARPGEIMGTSAAASEYYNGTSAIAATAPAAIGVAEMGESDGTTPAREGSHRTRLRIGPKAQPASATGSSRRSG